MYTLGGGSRPPAFQFPATDVPSPSTPPMFQAQPSALDTGAQDHLAWDDFGYDAILATMDGALQQADELAASQLTHPPPVLTQSSQFAAGGATRAGGASLAAGEVTPAGGGVTPAGRATQAGGGATPAGRVTPDTAGSSQAAMATPSPDQPGPRVVRAPDPWTYDRDHTWTGARAVRGGQGPAHLDVVL
jgi:hypothetical protein